MRRVHYVICILLITACASQPPQPQVTHPDIDALWDYEDPAASEQRFNDLLTGPDAKDSLFAAEVQTQIARTYSLRGEFAEADSRLDCVERTLAIYKDATRLRVRYLLERGRTRNSSGQADVANPLFLEAWELATNNGLEALAIDAAHMIAITLTKEPEAALAWNETALEMALASKDQKASRWQGSLLNNIGWTYFDMKDYEAALDKFEMALEFRKEQGKPEPTRIARWAIAKTQRMLGHVQEALDVQLQMAETLKTQGKPDGYVQEEIGECLLTLGREAEAQPYFARAYELLSKDQWLVANEPDRLKRMKELGTPKEIPATSPPPSPAP